MITGKFTEAEQALFNALEAKKDPIQAKLDELKAVIQAGSSTNDMVKAARAEIGKVQKGLVPLAEMQAGLANPISRDKYFPDFSKNGFITHVENALK